MVAQDVIALGKFFYGWRDTGAINGKGLPVYESTLMIRKTIGQLTQGDYIATEQDEEDYPDAWKAFQKQRKGIEMALDEGCWPLAVWPVLSQPDLESCFAHDIYTVEKLAASLERREIPPSVKEMAKRARRMVQFQQDIGQFEARINALEGQLQALREHNSQLLALKEEMGGQITALQTRLALIQAPIFAVQPMGNPA